MAAAACFLLAGAMLAGVCRAAISEVEKSYDGKVVTVDVRARTIDIEYPGVKAPLTVSLESVSLEDVTGRMSRPEVFKPGTAIRVRVREITTTQPADPARGPGRDNRSTTTTETVVKQIRMTAPPTPPAGTPAPAPTPAPAAKPSPATAPTPGAAAPPSKSAPPVPLGPAEVMSAAPQELAAVTLPAGTALVIALAENPQCQDTLMTVRLKCYKASVSTPDVQPDAAAVFYVTDAADLAAGSCDLAGPVGTANFWRDLLESTKTFLAFSGQNNNKNHEVSAGIAKFNITEPWRERRVAVAGSLKVPVTRLSPRAVAIVMMGGGKALSNILWIRFGPAAPAAKPAA